MENTERNKVEQKGKQHVYTLLTLYDPKFSTTHGKLASRPTATVTFAIGCAKRGSSIITETWIKLQVSVHEFIFVLFSFALVFVCFSVFCDEIMCEIKEHKKQVQISSDPCIIILFVVKRTRRFHVSKINFTFILTIIASVRVFLSLSLFNESNFILFYSDMNKTLESYTLLWKQFFFSVCRSWCIFMIKLNLNCIVNSYFFFILFSSSFHRVLLTTMQRGGLWCQISTWDIL